MKKMVKIFYIVLLVLSITGCSQKPLRLTFEESKTVPGTKIALSEFDSDFPGDWSSYNFLVLKIK